MAIEFYRSTNSLRFDRHTLEIDFRTIMSNDKDLPPILASTSRAALARDPMPFYETVPLDDPVLDDDTGNATTTSPAPGVRVVECTLQENPQMNCYYRFLATLHEIGHAISKLPCCRVPRHRRQQRRRRGQKMKEGEGDDQDDDENRESDGAKKITVI